MSPYRQTIVLHLTRSSQDLICVLLGMAFLKKRLMFVLSMATIDFFAAFYWLSEAMQFCIHFVSMVMSAIEKPNSSTLQKTE
jgi:hypothetical protein